MSTPTQGLTPAQLYALIKKYEGEIPIPAPFVTVNVGTLDADTGDFSGLTTQVTSDPEPMQHEPGQRPVNPPPRFEDGFYITESIDAQWRVTLTREPAPSVPLAPVLLQFNVANTSAAWSVTVGGYTTSVPAGQTTISVNVWDLTAVDWTLEVGGRNHADRLMIQRESSIPAAGGFTIPVIPVAIVYAPPADSTGKSVATYAQGNTVGTSITYDFSTDTSQTVEPAFADGAAFRALLETVGTALGLAGGAYATASKDITSTLSLFPSDSITEQAGVTIDNSSTVTVTYSSNSTIGTTAAGGGPGAGDTIVFFKDVFVAWAYDGGSLQLYPIGWTEVTVTAEQLQNDPAKSGIAAADQQLLLSFDPFVAGGPFAQPPETRFVVPDGVEASIEYGGGSTWNQSYTVTRDVKTLSSQKSYTTDTNSWSPGSILQMFGVGSSKSQVTTTATTATGGDTSDTVTLDVNLVSGVNDNFTLSIWYDTLFGTWAFQEMQPVTQPLVSGSGVAPGTIVTLESAGRVHATVADAHGNYEFHAPNIAPGQAELIVGDAAATTVMVPGEPTRHPGRPTAPVGPVVTGNRRA